MLPSGKSTCALPPRLDRHEHELAYSPLLLIQHSDEFITQNALRSILRVLYLRDHVQTFAQLCSIQVGFSNIGQRKT